MKRAVCGDVFAREVEDYILKLPLEQAQIAEALRDLILSASPRMEEQIKWGKPWFGCGKLTCYIAAAEDHVTLGFAEGAQLTDPAGILTGTGKNMRHVKLKSLKDIKRKQLTAWIKEAIKR
jgi:hypothetical protein